MILFVDIWPSSPICDSRRHPHYITAAHQSWHCHCHGITINSHNIVFSRLWSSAISRFHPVPAFLHRVLPWNFPPFVDSWQMPNWMMNVPLLRRNWSARAAIGCGGRVSSPIGRGRARLAATAHSPSVCTSSNLLLTSRVGAARRIVINYANEAFGWQYECFGCIVWAPLVSSWPEPAWCGPVLFSSSSPARLPDLTSQRWRLMTPPWLTAAGIEGQRRSFIIRWQVPFSSQPARLPTTCLFLSVLFLLSLYSLPPPLERRL